MSLAGAVAFEYKSLIGEHVEASIGMRLLLDALKHGLSWGPQMAILSTGTVGCH